MRIMHRSARRNIHQPAEAASTLQADQVAYTLRGAADAAGVGVVTLLRSIHGTDPALPRLTAQRLPDGQILIEADELRRWVAALPGAGSRA
jgi:hypothetical protein